MEDHTKIRIPAKPGFELGPCEKYHFCFLARHYKQDRMKERFCWLLQVSYKFWIKCNTNFKYKYVISNSLKLVSTVKYCFFNGCICRIYKFCIMSLKVLINNTSVIINIYLSKTPFYLCIIFLQQAIKSKIKHIIYTSTKKIKVSPEKVIDWTNSHYTLDFLRFYEGFWKVTHCF